MRAYIWLQLLLAQKSFITIQTVREQNLLCRLGKPMREPGWHGQVIVTTFNKKILRAVKAHFAVSPMPKLPLGNELQPGALGGKLPVWRMEGARLPLKKQPWRLL